jgi:hypothetical protein
MLENMASSFLIAFLTNNTILPPHKNNNHTIIKHSSQLPKVIRADPSLLYNVKNV